MRTTPPLPTLAAAALAALALSANAAIERGNVAGVAYAMGGIGLGERSELQAQRGQYNLWVSTAARSGAYLANVELRIVEESSGRVLLEGTMNGPWLFADLPPGRYTIEAKTASGGQSLKRQVRVQKGLRHEVLHFDVAETTADAGRLVGR